MPEINIKVESKRATADKDIKIVCDNADYLAVFEFDEEWAEHNIKTMVVRWGAETRHVIFEGNTATLPAITDSALVEIGVFAGELRTTTPALLLCERSILSGGGAPSEPPEDIYNQIIALLESIENISKEEVAAAIEEYLAKNDDASVKCTPQSLTDEEKQQACTNINAVSISSLGDGFAIENGETVVKSVKLAQPELAVSGFTGYFIQGGAVTEYPNNYISDFIEVIGGSTVKYHVNVIAGVSKVLCYFDSNRNFIGEVDAQGTNGSFTSYIDEITLPANAAYIRVSMSKNATTNEIKSASQQHVIYSACEASAAAPTVSVDISEELEPLYAGKTATGEIISVTDTVGGSIRGIAVNDGTAVETVKVTGKNIFKSESDATISANGVTVEWDADNQEFVFNGTTTASGDWKLRNPFSIDWAVGEKHTVSVRHVGGTATIGTESTAATTYAWGIFQDNAAKFIRGATGNAEFVPLYNFTATAFTPDANRKYIFYFQCWRKGTVFDNYRVKVQIEKGENVTEWEAYREASAPIGQATELQLQAGYNSVFTVPRAQFSLTYAVTPQTYIDSLLSGRGAWEGKKWYAFGTSITDTSYTNAETGTPTGKYVPYLAEMSGMTVVNRGLAGGTIGKGGAYGGSASILNRILTTDVSDADLITIEGFVNDFACEVPIGELGDTGGTDAIADTEVITIYGALYRAVKHCLETAPNARVVLLTESTGKQYTLTSTGTTADYRFDLFKGANHLCQKDYNDAIIETGRFMGVSVIDAGSKSQINYLNPEFIIDQIHHSELGGLQYARTIWDELKNISPKIVK